MHLDGDVSGDMNFSPHLRGTIAYPQPDYPFIAKLNTQSLSIETIHRLFTEDLASEFCGVCHDYGGAEGELAGIDGIDVLIAELFSQDVHTAVGQHRDEIEIFAPDTRRQVRDVITVAIWPHSCPRPESTGARVLPRIAGVDCGVRSFGAISTETYPSFQDATVRHKMTYNPLSFRAWSRNKTVHETLDATRSQFLSRPLPRS